MRASRPQTDRRLEKTIGFDEEGHSCAGCRNVVHDSIVANVAFGCSSPPASPGDPGRYADFSLEQREGVKQMNLANQDKYFRSSLMSSDFSLKKYQTLCPPAKTSQILFNYWAFFKAPPSAATPARDSPTSAPPLRTWAGRRSAEPWDSTGACSRPTSARGTPVSG